MVRNLKWGLLVIPYLVGVPCGHLIWPVSGSPYPWELYALMSIAAAAAVGFVGLAANGIARFVVVDDRYPAWSPAIALAFLAGELTFPAYLIAALFVSGGLNS